MKKYLVHFAYFLIIAFFVVYARIKAGEAEKQTLLAITATEASEKSAIEAERQAELAMEQALKLPARIIWPWKNQRAGRSFEEL